MHHGLRALQASGAKLGLPGFFCELAGVQGEAGRVDEGLALLTEALAVVAHTGERFSEAELYRLKGELLLNAERGTQKDEPESTGKHYPNCR